MRERYELAVDRIREIRQEKNAPANFQGYFFRMAEFLEQMIELKDEVEHGVGEDVSLDVLRAKNKALYQDILPGNYEISYANPEYACKMLGRGYGQLLSFLYTELRGMIIFSYEKREWDFLVCMELFLQVYSEFEDGQAPEPETIRQVLYWYVNDYCQEMVEYRIQSSVDDTLDFAARRIMEADLDDLRYLYQFGEYVTEAEEKTARFLNTLPKEEVRAMARTYTEGYRIGFINTGKDITKKRTVNIRYCLGFERMIKEAILQFREMKLEPVIYRAAVHTVNKRQQFRIGYYGAIPNPQYDYDHRNDAAIYLDDDFVGRKLRAMQRGYEKYKKQAGEHGGPAVVEIFGELPFVPKSSEMTCSLNEKQQKLQVSMNNEAGQITNRYIKGEERSFTIIAYPVPSIGDHFEEIFRETVKINTLDYNLYASIQQKLIDALDQGKSVHIMGRNGNKTDLRVMLHDLRDRDKETNFENCVADVNIPVGEVFTSPVLQGTNGILHVKKVYLEELQYRELELEFVDGKVARYDCSNFDDPKKNAEYIRENILHNHKTLPMGEFAIGTNTTAYQMAVDHQIQDKLPILIAEKTGPHFAVGDTCYSWAEDTKVYNPDGKEIIARDNEISIRRKDDPGAAYFGCHTDITIPYDELGRIVVECEDGSGIELIRDGRFVLDGTSILNEALK
ncbi:MAG: leucyl aminopeptidase [Clostridia bacterium]|nr:leucyl aminopeptidase [Clostridia bacterium]